MEDHPDSNIDARRSQGFINESSGTVTQTYITNNIQEASTYRHSGLHQLPSIPEHFIGRDEQIQALCNSIRTNATTSTTNVIINRIQGMGGVGKTTLAIVVAHALTKDFPDAQLLIGLGANSPNPLTAAQARDQILRAFYPDIKLSKDEASRWGQYRTALQDKRALLIFDDVHDNAHVKPLLPPAGCATLITSRQNLTTSERIQLPMLSHAESITLLRHYRANLTEEQADTLATLCADLPMALSVAGSLLDSYESVSTEAFITSMKTDRISKLTYEDTAVQRVFAISYEKLNPKLQKIWCTLSIMPANFDFLAAAAVGEFDTNATPGPLDELVKLNLLEFDARNKRFRWHDLLREFASGLLAAETRTAALIRHAKHYTQVAHQAITFLDKNMLLEGQNLFDTERIHIEATYNNLKRLNYTQILSGLLVGVCKHLDSLRFPPQLQMEWLQTRLDEAQQVGGYWEAQASLEVGNAYMYLGNTLKAIKLFERALPLFRAWERKASIGQTLTSLGIAYTYLGKNRKAIEILEQAIDFHRETGNRDAEGNALDCLGVAYTYLRDSRKAIELYEQALKLYDKTGDRSSEGVTLHNLGVANFYLNDFQRAIDFYEQALIIFRENDNRAFEGNALANLGNAYSHLNAPLKAIEFYKQALILYRKTGYRYGEGNTLTSLGNTYSDLGNYFKAIETLEQARILSRETASQDTEVSALLSLSKTHKQFNNITLAIQFAIQAREIAVLIESSMLASVERHLDQLQQKL